MQIVETSVFTRLLAGLLSEEEYRGLQAELVARPHAGALIQGGGGIRKVRWAAQGKGKSGGVRLIYYWAPPKIRS